jgi:hypothetical protein
VIGSNTSSKDFTLKKIQNFQAEETLGKKKLSVVEEKFEPRISGTISNALSDAF